MRGRRKRRRDAVRRQRRPTGHDQVQPCGRAGLRQGGDPRLVRAVGQRRERRDHEQQGVPRTGRLYPLFGIGQRGLQPRAVGDRRGHQARGDQGLERPEDGTGRIDPLHPHRAGRVRGHQPKHQAAQQAGDARITGVCIDREVTGAEERHDRGKARVVDRLRLADAHEPARRRARWCRGDRVAEPAGRKGGCRRAQGCGEFGQVRGYRFGCGAVHGALCRVSHRGRPAVQRGGPFHAQPQLRHASLTSFARRYPSGGEGGRTGAYRVIHRACQTPVCPATLACGWSLLGEAACGTVIGTPPTGRRSASI